MSMKVKVIKGDDASALERLINDWLKENAKVHVDHVTQSQVQHGQHMSMPVTVCIWYTEGGE